MKTNEIDTTIIVDDFMPKKWKCPHCSRINSTGEYSNDILAMHGKVIEQCGGCGYLHLFRLELTQEFKEKTMQYLQKVFDEEKCPQTPIESATEGNLNDAI